MFTILLLFCCQCIMSNDNNNGNKVEQMLAKEISVFCPTTFSTNDLLLPPLLHIQDHQLKPSSAIFNLVCEAVDSDVSVEIDELTFRI